MRKPTGFTLIELLLVLVIIGVVAGVTVPSYVQSMRGNRMRSAARTLAACGRYARSMAVLHQRPVQVTFALHGNTVEVDFLRLQRRVDGAGALPGVRDGDLFAEVDEDEEGGAKQGVPDDSPIHITRTLDGVSITRVEMGRQRSQMDLDGDVASVLYDSNGRCEPYRVTVTDDDGTELIVAVDMLGSAEILSH